MFGWLPILQARHGSCTLCTERGITFLDSPFPQLPFGVLLALVQTLYRPRFRREFAWISIDGTTQRSEWRPTLQARHGLCALCTERRITFLNSPYRQLLVGVLLEIVQTLYRPRFRREFAWISIKGIIQRSEWRLILQARHGFCALCTERKITFLTSPYRQLLVGVLLALVQTLYRQTKVHMKRKLWGRRAWKRKPLVGAKSAPTRTDLQTAPSPAAPYRAVNGNLRKFGATYRPV